MAALLKPFGNLLSPKRTVPTGRLRIDWSHPLARGLLVCYLPGTSLGIDITGQVPDLTVGVNQTNFPAQAMGPEGPGLNTLKNGGFGFAYLFGTATPPLKTWSSLSLYWRGFIGQSSDNPPNDTDLFGITYDNVSTPPFSVVNINANSTNQFSIRWNSAGTNANTANTALSQNAVNSVGGTLQVGGNGVAYQSGVAISSVSFGAGAPQSSATSQIDIGVYYNQTTRFSNSVTFLACAWNRVLSASEMAWLDAEPYAFLLPDEGEMPALFVAAAGGSSAVLNADGVASTSFVASGQGNAVLNAAGAASTNFVAKAVGNAVLNADGVAAASFVAKGQANAVLNADGLASTAFSAKGLGNAVLNADGVSSASFIAQGQGTVLNAAGAASTNFIVAGKAIAVLNADGVASTGFVGAGKAVAVLNAAGIATTSYAGTAALIAALNAAGSSSTNFIGQISGTSSQPIRILGQRLMFQSSDRYDAWNSITKPASALNLPSKVTVDG